VKHLLTRFDNSSLGFRSMIELIEQTALALAGINFGIAGASLLVGVSMKKIRAHTYSMDLPVYQDLPDGVY